MDLVAYTLGGILSDICFFLGELTLFSLGTFRCFIREGFPQKKFVLKQLYEVGNRSVSVIFSTGLFTGLILAVESIQQLKLVQMESMVGGVVGISMVRELGPVLAGLMIAGRVGAQITAELGSMKVTQQVDALEALALDPLKFLVLPRVLACTLMAPLLTAIAAGIGLLGATVLVVHVYHVNSFFYLSNLKDWVTNRDITIGLVKSAVFGLLIALTCCYNGLKTQGGAEGVGSATTTAVVASSILVLAADFFLALVL